MGKLLSLLLICAGITACSSNEHVNVTDAGNEDSRSYARRVDNAIHLTAMIDERIARARRAGSSELSSTPVATPAKEPPALLKATDTQRHKLDPEVCPLTTEEGRAILAQTPEGRALLDQQ